MINITEVRVGQEEEALVLKVLRSGQLAQGGIVKDFEKLFADIHQVEHAVAVNNGTTALVSALLALNLEPGDEVITSPFSFVATLNSILEAGATARFADIGDDFCISPQSVECLIGPRTKAIMPVHLFGQPSRMDEISAIAEKYGLIIIEDAAQAHGAKFMNRSVGSYGLGCFSFYATKNITTGEGGIITTNNSQYADQLRLLRNQGMRARYQYEIQGHNFRMTDLQAAIGIPQLKRLDEISSKRRMNAQYLTDGLAGIKGLRTPITFDERQHVFHQYTIRVTSDGSVSREQLAGHLEKNGIASGLYYPKLMHDYACFKNNSKIIFDSTPNAVRATEEVLSIPVHQYLSMKDLNRIIEVVREACQ